MRFFDWCRFNLHHYLEKLDAADKKEFESGKISKDLLDVVQAAWSDNLKNHSSWHEHFTVIRNVLTNPRDYDLWMNCPMGQTKNLPKRIQIAVANGEAKRANEIHDTFFANEGVARLAIYLRVWQSQNQAMDKIILKALGRTYKAGGDSSFGKIRYDAEQMFLTEAEAAGTAMIRGLLPFVVSLWEADSPHQSEARLNRFLINLGRKLASKKNHRKLPDWLNGVDQTERFIVLGWCENIIVDNEPWPMLCCLTSPALKKFLRLCNVTHCKLGGNSTRTIERSIQRLGLVRLPRSRIKYVEKRLGQFCFT